MLRANGSGLIGSAGLFVDRAAEVSSPPFDLLNAPPKTAVTVTQEAEPRGQPAVYRVRTYARHVEEQWELSLTARSLPLDLRGTDGAAVNFTVFLGLSSQSGSGIGTGGSALGPVFASTLAMSEEEGEEPRPETQLAGTGVGQSMQVRCYPSTRKPGILTGICLAVYISLILPLIYIIYSYTLYDVPYHTYRHLHTVSIPVAALLLPICRRCHGLSPRHASAVCAGRRAVDCHLDGCFPPSSSL